jgi:recombinational DNA repair ATPase RecF
MPQATLTQRVGSLEAGMDDVESRLATVATELKAFRIEARQEFAAVRTEIGTLGETFRTEIATLGATLRTEITASGERVREELRQEIQDGNDESRRFARVLHEDLVERITAIGDGSRPPSGRRRPRKV